MKRYIYVLSAAALVMLAACQKEESSNSKVGLTATLEQQVGTKTALGTDNTIVWSAEDEISVHTDNGAEVLTIVSGDGTTSGGFGSTVGDNPDYAVYPSSVNPSFSGSTITFTLPAVQTYAPNSFGNGANVAVAKINGGNMAFKNVCGALKLQLKGHMIVKTIELTGKGGEKLSGKFTVDAAASPFSGAVKLGDPTDDEKKVTLDCSAFGETSEGVADGGVQLDMETPTIFNIIVPVSAFASGFDAKITDAVGETVYATVSSSNNNEIERSTITKMPSKSVILSLPTGYKALEYLKAPKGAVINTGISGNNDNLTVYCRFMYENYTKYGAIYANYVDEASNTFRVIMNTNSNQFICCYNTHTPLGDFYGELYANVWYNIVQNRLLGTIINGSTDFLVQKRAGSKSAENNTEIALFGSRVTSVGSICGVSMSYWKAKDNTGCLSYLIPAKRISDSEIGMYDMITGQFLENCYDGHDETVPVADFIAGPELTD